MIYEPGETVTWTVELTRKAQRGQLVTAGGDAMM